MDVNCIDKERVQFMDSGGITNEPEGESATRKKQKKMNNKVIIPVFIVLFLLGFIPFPFTSQSSLLLFGWLPAPLAYWWTLMFIDLIFAFCVCSHFVKVSCRKEENK